MEEKGVPPLYPCFLESRGEPHEVVVMNPYQIIILCMPCHHPGILRIHRYIASPISGVETAPRLQVVEERPEHLVRKAVIKLVRFFVGKEYRIQTETPLLGGWPQYSAQLTYAQCFRGAKPPYPNSAAILQYWR